MLKIYRFDHIGQVVPELDPQVKLLEGLFGFERLLRWENREEGWRGETLAVPGSWGQCWEVLAPLGDASPLQAFLDSPQGPGLHHVAVEVPDLDTATEELQLGPEPSIRGKDRCIDVSFGPRDGNPSLLFRLFESSPHAPCIPESGERSLRPKCDGAKRPNLGIVAVEQICQAFRDRDELARWCRESFGMQELYRTREETHPDYATLIMNIHGTAMRWEVIHPRGQDSFVQRYLDRRGAGAHHVSFQVGSWERAMAACEHWEIPTFEDNQGVTDGGRWRDTFIHPRHTGGVLVQLFWEERPGIWARSDKVAPEKLRKDRE